MVTSVVVPLGLTTLVPIGITGLMRGPKRLLAYLKWKGWSQSDLARAIGHHQTSVGRLLTGKRGPGVDVVHAIESLTKDWKRGPIRTEEWVDRGQRRSPGNDTTIRDNVEAQTARMAASRVA